jgi:hypothetical protein
MVRVGTVQGIAGARLCNAKHNAASPTTATCMSAARQRARPSNVHAERRESDRGHLRRRCGGPAHVGIAAARVLAPRCNAHSAPSRPFGGAWRVQWSDWSACPWKRHQESNGGAAWREHESQRQAHLTAAEMGGRVSSVDSGGRHHSVHRKRNGISPIPLHPSACWLACLSRLLIHGRVTLLRGSRDMLVTWLHTM